MHLRIPHVLIAFAAANAVDIVPPSPYMSSPPPVQADTTEVDPGRKPRILTVEPGIEEQWFTDWDLVADRSSSGPTDVTGPRVGRHSYRVAFNNHGWPTEINYFDVKGNARWTKLFRYPSPIPAGPGDVAFTVSWIGSQGSAISMTRISATYKSATWKVGQKKYQVSDLLGEPLLVTSSGGGIAGSAETWVYLVDGKEARFSFNKDNGLVALPEIASPKVESTLAKPTVSPVDTATKAKATTATAKQKPAKK
jgi:hypothetical protein